mmetsp:Transcript_78820/g.96379  ORF Transcript_78820/g.96379 Transcript_78820/m.96379 type:complete len:290 (+) Transcript_78820:609-1478(+)
MKQTGHKIIKPINNILNINCKRNVTAFDPFYYLHENSANRDQNKTFAKVFHENIGDFKSKLSDDELKLLSTKVDQITGFEEFKDKMRGLMGPKRHEFIRKTRTWQFVNECVIQYCNENGVIPLIFGEDNEFDEFKNEYLIKEETLLADFVYADLRFMAACCAIDYCNGPKISAVFGCRNQYHYKYPDVYGHSATWQNCIYDRCDTEQLVILTALNAIKDNEPINVDYFYKNLNSMDDNALKDDSWRPFATKYRDMDSLTFYDKFDRSFIAFQTDPGVSPLSVRFPNDLF